MTERPQEHPFVIEDLRVLTVSAEAGGGPAEVECAWSAQYFDPDPEIGDEYTRVLTGRLHAHGPEGWATVVVGGLIIPVTPLESTEDEALEALLLNSSALEALYDFARPHLRSLSGIVDAHLEVPFKGPEAKLEHGNFSLETDGSAAHTESS